MQLDKLVNFYKTLGDPTRIRIIAILKKEPLNGQMIAKKLGLKPPTITHHISKLRDIGLISQRREGNSIYFHLNKERLNYNSKAILNIGGENMTQKDIEVTDKEKQSIVNNFFDTNGKLKNIPSQRKKKVVILAYLLRDLQHGKVYKEQEINDYVKSYHEDFATIRREWIMNHFMYRENNLYELNPKEMWPIVF
ncbi:metalloregulator ArsR/SmtB family transcription factor [Priestia megaterium]|uniref:DUF2087 domain-containing protein n=1 Tax=Priestia megaterium TaxID=1404 RepID=UPI0025B15FE6|nr:metalloregulator ArsR/SmtB family transcription factor [Priestia megaterium]MDN3362656.1 metalloregulator ArsR/SmtB family transcription factor [Priestia megaterium]WKU21405.1 metalloregulator ArsR/SmtB family transcription factor [Priestia megaterium]